ncbi:MBL fold metallo-hydrolase [Leifsonia poae]|uniref:MBL fold metallo-hydrolase n=1 Tax=Leifsonia poae TaxID=110933 RepID=UPI001CBEEC2F|nr:MBL fold metallo-hydrolase [Leifsonia poae]
MKLGPSLHRVGNDIVAAYLVEDETGVTVIDAGLTGHWHDLTRELETMGRTPADIRGLILTHGDTDHIGFAQKLHDEFGVPLYIHEADAARAQGKEKSSGSFGKYSLGATIGFLAYTIRKGGMRNHYLTEVRTVKDGDELGLPGRPRIVGMPGHSPGSIAVFVPSVDAVFVGDALTTRNVLTGKTGPQPAPFTDEPGEALDSLSRLDEVKATWVLPGHGAPWNGGVSAAVSAIRATGGPTA